MLQRDSVFRSILSGFWVTVRNIFRPLQTLEYPEVKRPQPPTFRGKHRLQRYEDGLERCVGCGLCASVCPSEAICLEAAENTDEDRVSPGERYSKRYRIHLLRCIFCGYCSEACPESAIVLGSEYELAGYKRESFVMEKEDLLTPKEEGFGNYPIHKPTVGAGEH